VVVVVVMLPASFIVFENSTRRIFPFYPTRRLWSWQRFVSPPRGGTFRALPSKDGLEWQNKYPEGSNHRVPPIVS